MPLRAGSRLGPYEIMSALGAGGMGEVYQATDMKLKRQVAIKVLPASVAADPERLARFQREAEVLAALNHPNIAHIHGLEESNGLLALVMELVEGEDLSQRIARGAVPLDEALPIAKQIAEALEAAHEQGIIHRDLKPANIKVRPDGMVKVLDFGLAKAMEPVGVTPASLSRSPTITTPAMMTGVGVLLGTAAYMSPEQAKGRAADKRSDIWAFGCVFFEMLTGKRTFDGDDVSDTLAAVLRSEPDWSGLPTEVPSGISRLIRRCLAKDRRERVGDLAVARFVFSDPASGGQFTASSDNVIASLRRPRWQVVAALVAVVMVTATVVGFAAWLTRPIRPEPTVARATFRLPDAQQFTTETGHNVAISPNGEHLVYIANSRLFLWSMSEFEGHEIAGTQVAAGIAISDPVFSPDGRSIALYSDGAIRRLDLTGGPAVKICDADPTLGISWDAGGLVFGQGAKGVLRCSADGGAPEQLITVEEGEQAQGPQMLPGGKEILLTIARTGDGVSRWDKAHVVVQPLSSSLRKTLVNGGGDARYLRTGHVTYVLGGAVFAVPFDVHQQKVMGRAVPVVEGVRRSIGAVTNAAQYGIADNGTFVYIPGPASIDASQRTIALADRTGAVTRLSVPPRPYTHVRASRDGTRLAIGTENDNEAIVWIYNVNPSAMRRLTLEGHNRFPIWSPDGQRVAFQSDREGDAGIFVQRADGTGGIERFTKAGADEAHVPESWSPNGKFLSYSVTKAGTFSLWILSVDDKNSVPFGDVHSVQPIGSVFSPDGRWIVYFSSPYVGGFSGKPATDRGVFIQPFPATGEHHQVPKQQLDFHPVWGPKGTELFYLPTTISGQLAVVSVTTKPSISFGTPSLLPARVTGNRLADEARAFDILPDGTFVGLMSSESETNGPPVPEIRVVTNWFEDLRARVPIK